MEEVETFTYHQVSINYKQGGSGADLKAQIHKEIEAFLQLMIVQNSKQLSGKSKVRIFNNNIKTVALYGVKTWRTTKIIIKKVQVFINSCLWKIFHIRLPDTISNDLL